MWGPPGWRESSQTGVGPYQTGIGPPHTSVEPLHTGAGPSERRGHSQSDMGPVRLAWGPPRVFTSDFLPILLKRAQRTIAGATAPAAPSPCGDGPVGGGGHIAHHSIREFIVSSLVSPQLYRDSFEVLRTKLITNM